ncbi:MAG TPA: glutamate-cysteine ligase family protein [Polyangiaceae bacterium]|nr:glutamate-cysteine ligase family protein [Polyangiaceae bacterium]
MSLTPDDLLSPFFEAMKPKARWRIGAEAEKIGVHEPSQSVLDYEGENGVVGILAALSQRFGWKRITENEGGPLIALERDHASVTLEPGAQLELSGAPLDDVHAVYAETQAHLAELHEICSPKGIAFLGVGFHPFARQAELPWVPKLRYSVMKEYLPTRGDRALDMMRRTATVQANFDYESEEDAMRKLRVALRLSPVVTAMFANSPFYEGRVTGERSERAKVWLAVDPDRQGLLPSIWNANSGIRGYVEWALDAPMFLFKREGKVVANTGQTFRSFWADGFQGHRPDIHDWEMHLNTLFPEVRLKRTLEVRGGDSLPERLSSALPALWTGILYDDVALAEADALTADFKFAEMEALRPELARAALRAPFRGKPLAAVAERLVEIAWGGLARRRRLSLDGRDESIHLTALAALVERGDCPADELLRGLPSDPRLLANEIVRRTKL